MAGEDNTSDHRGQVGVAVSQRRVRCQPSTNRDAMLLFSEGAQGSGGCWQEGKGWCKKKKKKSARLPNRSICRQPVGKGSALYHAARTRCQTADVVA